MLNWFLQLVFDEFDYVITDDVLDLQYNKLNWFLECQKFHLGYNCKNLRLFVGGGFLNAGPYYSIVPIWFKVTDLSY